MAEGYETFVRELADLHEGRKALLVLRDLTPGRRKYFAQNVIGVVQPANGEPDPSGEWRPLIVRSAVGHRFPGAWRVSIVELLPPAAPGAPYTDAYAALQAAWGSALDR